MRDKLKDLFFSKKLYIKTFKNFWVALANSYVLSLPLSICNTHFLI